MKLLWVICFHLSRYLAIFPAGGELQAGELLGAGVGGGGGMGV